MSHVWGQTLPSNYGRLSPSAQREFNTGADDLAKKAAKEAAEAAIKELEAKLGKKVIRELLEEVEGEFGEKVSKELMAKAMKETMEQVGEGGGSELIEKTLRKNLKNLAEEAGQKTTKTVTKKTTKNATEKLAETTTERATRTLIRTGGAVIGAVLLLDTFMESDAIKDLVKSQTGQDCDEKAEAASLVEGTPEFTEHVTECQEKAAEGLASIGKLVTYGGLAIGGLIAISILGKLGLFGSSGDGE